MTQFTKTKRLKLKLTNLDDAVHDVVLFRSYITKTLFSTTYTASYGIGTTYSIVKNGITISGTLASAMTISQFASELSNAVGENVLFVENATTQLNHFLFPTTNVYSLFSIIIA